ncbi:S53 family peptidase [Dinghuibacter silviterrae]|uniref:Kumamolisin n=1 Tax=Dinghuibacter silviterrae TaxID=1539049 RepID=A0A4V3GM27_9BACT|nr:S53 family peptidase [Dinghuibacter silviterrae]TDX01863.1 kumamolisin [Dinghuibacter silviterrae]
MPPLTHPTGFQAIYGSAREPLPGAVLKDDLDPQGTVHISLDIRKAPGQQIADAGDIDLVTQYLQGKGLTVTDTDTRKRSIQATGTITQMEAAFQVSLHRYQSPQQEYRGRDGSILLPDNLIPIVQGVFGLDNRTVSSRKRTVPPVNVYPSPLSPADIAKAYRFPPAADVSGQRIALLEFGGQIYPGDIQGNCDLGYFQTPPVLQPYIVTGPGETQPRPNILTEATEDDLEVGLDIAIASALAPGVNIDVYFGSNTEKGWIDTLKAVVYGDTPPHIISISWGGAEHSWTVQATQSLSEVFEDAARQNISVLAASGDKGVCGGRKDNKVHVEYPASDPHVTACGGTLIETATDGTWSEIVWNTGGAPGGGLSSRFTTPPEWQKELRFPTPLNHNPHPHTPLKGRWLPDIAGQAMLTSFILNGNHTGPVHGTSVAAPLYAGLIALLNTHLGKPLGFLNPILYAQKDKGVFHPVREGNNAWPPLPGYSAAPGWNACTGLGSIDATALLDILLTQLQSPTLSHTSPALPVSGH